MSFHCTTCADDGTPMRVVRIRDDALALCESPDGKHHTVEVALVDVEPGDTILVHAGVALVAL